MDDVRIALRLLRRDKAFTLTAAATLAICIGANTALFAVVYGVLLKPLSVPESERIVSLGNTYPRAGIDFAMGAAIPDYFDRLRETTAFEEQAIYRSESAAVARKGVATRVPVMRATPSFFRLLRARPALGRVFSEEEGTLGHEQRVVLSYGFWQAQFGGDVNAIGSDLRLDGRPYTVIGVMPRGFSFVDNDAELWRPMAFTDAEKSDEQRHSNNVSYIARLKPGVTLQQAQAQIDALNARNLDRFPESKQVLLDTGFHTVVRTLQDQIVRDVRPALYLMWGGALFVLLIGGMNVANLALVRSRARLKELATRLALGAGALRLARQLIVESMLLAMVAAVAGLGLGWAAIRLLGTMPLDELPRASEIRVDVLVIAYTLGIAAAIGVVLGLIPAAAAVRSNPNAVLREEGRTGTSARGARTLRRTLVVVQVGCAFVLLIASGLLFASFRKVVTLDPGFAPEPVMTATVSLPRARYGDADSRRRFMTEALRRIRALPGVRAAGAAEAIPFGNSFSRTGIMAEGSPPRAGESIVAPAQVRASDGYFEAIGARLVKGRFFDERDGPGGLPAAIIDESLANRFWPGQDPIGRHIHEPADGPDPSAITATTELFTVVGVIGDIKQRDLTESGVGAFYRPLAQVPQERLIFVVKGTGNPAALISPARGVIAELDREVPVFDEHPMTYWVDRSLARRRSPTLLSIGFGAVALFLSAIGIYGVLAYLVTQRTREIGIRVALGSTAAAVFALVLREGLLLVGAGLLLGGIAAMVLSRNLAGQLYGVTATNPVVLTAVGLLLGVVAIAACSVPARRATRIDPVTALAD